MKKSVGKKASLFFFIFSGFLHHFLPYIFIYLSIPFPSFTV